MSTPKRECSPFTSVATTQAMADHANLQDQAQAQIQAQIQAQAQGQDPTQVLRTMQLAFANEMQTMKTSYMQEMNTAAQKMTAAGNEVENLRAKVAELQIAATQATASAASATPAPAPSNAMALMELAKFERPPRYPGQTSTMPLHTWLHLTITFLRHIGCPPTEWAKYAKMRLEGTAAVWNELRERTAQVMDEPWDSFVSALKRQFSAVNQGHAARAALQDIVQGSSIQEHCTKFADLLLSVEDMTETEAVFLFVQSLKQQTRVHVGMQEPKTVDEAYAIAQRFDSLMSESSRTRFHDSARTQDPRKNEPRFRGRDTGPVPMDVGPAVVSGNQGTQCYGCGQFGHIKRNCPNPKRKTGMTGAANGQTAPQVPGNGGAGRW